MTKEIEKKKKEIGNILSELREDKNLNNFQTWKDWKIADQTIKAVIEGNKSYTIDTLLILLNEVKKTIKIVDIQN